MRTCALLIVLFATICHSSTLTYDMAFAQDPGGPADFAIRMLFDDDVTGQPDAIRALVTLTPGRYTGDIVALYLNLTSLVMPLPATITSISDAIAGADITKRAINTSNVQNGNIGATYSIGLAIGAPGIEEGKGDIQSTEFLMNTSGLSLQHLGGVAARVTSIGEQGGPRSLSAKLLNDSGLLRHSYEPTSPVGDVPEPATFVLAGSALIAAGSWKYRRSRKQP